MRHFNRILSKGLYLIYSHCRECQPFTSEATICQSEDLVKVAGNPHNEGAWEGGNVQPATWRTWFPGMLQVIIHHPTHFYPYCNWVMRNVACYTSVAWLRIGWGAASWAVGKDCCKAKSTWFHEGMAAIFSITFCLVSHGGWAGLPHTWVVCWSSWIGCGNIESIRRMLASRQHFSEMNYSWNMKHNFSSLISSYKGCPSNQSCCEKCK